jgi:hypothetical protein
MVKRKYRVCADVTISVSTVVEAESKEQAIEMAQEREMQGLCHQCSTGNDREEWSLSGEIDGEPMNLRIEQ